MQSYKFLCVIIMLLFACKSEPKVKQAEPVKPKSAAGTSQQMQELSPEIQKRVALVQTLFDEDKIVDNFLNLDKYANARTITKSPRVRSLLTRQVDYELPETFVSRDSTYNTKEFLDHTLSTGMLILHRGQIVMEEYWRGMQKESTHISWSVGKSFVSAMIGIAISEKLIKSEKDMVVDYLPELRGTGYENVSIQHCLQMSSGVKWTEDYGDPDSDIGKFSVHFAMGKPVIDFIKTIEPDKEPGTYNHYVSMDTQVLGMVLKKVIGDRSLSAYLKEKIWDMIGMEHDAQWLVDDAGMEYALGGLNVTLRDYARFGLLYLNKGFLNGKQMLSANWIRKSVRTSKSHLKAGRDNPDSSNPFGYGYQWWIPINQMIDDYFASGIYNQYIYINPSEHLLIVKTSANPHFTEADDFSKEAYIDLFQTIAKTIDSSRY